MFGSSRMERLVKICWWSGSIPEQGARLAATHHQDARSFDSGLFAVLFDADFARAFVAAPALDKFNLVFLKEKFDTLGMFFYDLVFAGQDVGPIHRQTTDFESQFRSKLEMVINIGVVQQYFGGNASDVQAGAAKKGIFFDNHSLQAQFARANRGYISARPAPDNRNVVLSHAPSL